MNFAKNHCRTSPCLKGTIITAYHQHHYHHHHQHGLLVLRNHQSATRTLLCFYWILFSGRWWYWRVEMEVRRRVMGVFVLIGDDSGAVCIPPPVPTSSTHLWFSTSSCPYFSPFLNFRSITIHKRSSPSSLNSNSTTRDLSPPPLVPTRSQSLKISTLLSLLGHIHLKSPTSPSCPHANWFA